RSKKVFASHLKIPPSFAGCPLRSPSYDAPTLITGCNDNCLKKYVKLNKQNDYCQAGTGLDRARPPRETHAGAARTNHTCHRPIPIPGSTTTSVATARRARDLAAQSLTFAAR